MNSAYLQAMVDSTVTDEFGLMEISDSEVAKKVFMRAALRLNLPQVVARIRNSLYTTELFACLPQLFGDDRPMLNRIAEAVTDDARKEDPLHPWESSALQTFVDRFWTRVVRERLVKNDYRRAWDEIRKSARSGLNDIVVLPTMLMSKVLSASEKTTRGLVNEIYEALLNKELIDPISSEVPKRIPYSFTHSMVAGERFAVDMYYFTSDRFFTPDGKKVLAIARYVNDIINAKRRKSTAARIATL